MSTTTLKDEKERLNSQESFEEQSRSSFDEVTLNEGDWETWHRRRRGLIFHWTPWCVLSCMLSIVLLFQVVMRERGKASSFGTYEEGFQTDIDTMGHIPLEQKRFATRPHDWQPQEIWPDLVNKSDPWPENLQFFGLPTPEIDSNWHRIVGSLWFSISEDEAKAAWGDRRFDYVDQRFGGYSAGLSVIHTLHCVNQIRKTIHQDYYYPEMDMSVHAEHCLEIIRQEILCHGDTSLVPQKFQWTDQNLGIGHTYSDGDQLHTCRSFDHIHSWVKAREDDGLAYVDRDRSIMSQDATTAALADWHKSGGK